jgi:hypothetical protein
MRLKSFLIALLLLTSLIPMSRVEAVSYTLEAHVVISFIDGHGAWSGSITCISDTGDTATGMDITVHGNDIICSGSPEFSVTPGEPGDTRFRLAASVHKYDNQPGDSDYWADAYVQPSNTDWEILDNTQGLSNGTVGYAPSPYPNPAWVTLKSSTISTEEEHKSVTFYFHVANHEFNTSTTGINSCDSKYAAILTVTSSMIIPNSESGLEFTNLTNGQKYELTIEGGPWNDGEGNANRYDTAIKEGESSWVTTDTYTAGENINCNQLDPTHPWTTKLVFTAIDSSFAVRLNDMAGEFGDNTYGSSVMNATLKTVNELSGDCSGQFLQGQLLGTGTLSAVNSTGYGLSTMLGPNAPKSGDWFIIKVTGSWKNNGTGSDLKTLAMKHTGWVIWEHLSTTASTWCVNGDTYYVQQTEASGDYRLRVDDTDGNWGANTGSLTVSIYGVAQYNRYQNGCELQYTIGDLIETKTVQGNLSNGLPIDNRTGGIWDPIGGTFAIPIRYYMLETFGGPVDLGGGDLTWDINLGQSTLEGSIPSTYYPIPGADFVECLVTTDAVGHIRAFFPKEYAAEVYTYIEYYYGIRIADDAGTYTDNTGSISYRLYEATDQQNPAAHTPSADGCLQFQHETTALSSQVLYAFNNSTGLSLGAFTSGELYAISITGGPWLDNGSSRYDVELSDDNGSTWTDLADYINVLCSQSSDGSHVMVFLYGAAGKVWKVRVNDQDSSWGNNAGSVLVSVYPGSTQRSGYPKCDSNYTLTQVALGSELRKVPGNMGDGKSLPGIISGNVYAVEITSEAKWYEAGTGTGSYLVDISDDNGSTWTNLEDYASLCTMMIGNGGIYKVYFTATSTTYKLRVRDGDGNFLSNTGEIYFNLYSAVDKTNPGSHSGNNTPPPEWVVACNQSYTRPNYIIDWASISFPFMGSTISFSIPVPAIAAWLEYGKNAIVSYFAWCPQHTEALMNISEVYTSREPIVTIVDYVNLLKTIRNYIDESSAQGGADTETNPSQEPSFFSDYDQIGATGSASYVAPPSGPFDMFIPVTLDKSKNPLFGGQLDLTTIGTGSSISGIATYKASCMTRFSDTFGIATDTFCRMTGILRYTKVITWVLLVLDIIAVLWLVFKYYPSWGRRLWTVISNRNNFKGI